MPNKRQIKLIRKIVAADCLIADANIDDKCRTCVIGALAIASGTSERTLRQERYIKGAVNDLPIIAIRRMERKFGLTFDQLDHMQDLNDRFPTPRQRRKIILALDFLQLKPSPKTATE